MTMTKLRADDADAFRVVAERLSDPTQILTAQVWIAFSRQMQRDPDLFRRMVDATPEDICEMVSAGVLR